MNKSHTLRWGMSLLALAALMACGEAPASSGTSTSSKEAESSSAVVSSSESVEETTEAEETTQATAEHVWFVAGSFNSWGQKDENYALEEMTMAPGTFAIVDISLKAGAQFKIMGGTGETAEWYPASNVVISENGKYTIVFAPEGGLEPMAEGAWVSDDTKVGYMKTGEYEGEIGEVEYYLSGALNEWAPKDTTHKLTKMEEKKDGKDQYSILGVELPAGGLKVVDSDGVWYPDGMGTEYNVPEAGTYDVYFVPEGGIADWSSFGGGYFYVGAHVAAE